MSKDVRKKKKWKGKEKKNSMYFYFMAHLEAHLIQHPPQCPTETQNPNLLTAPAYQRRQIAGAAFIFRSLHSRSSCRLNPGVSGSPAPHPASTIFSPPCVLSRLATAWPPLLPDADAPYSCTQGERTPYASAPALPLRRRFSDALITMLVASIIHLHTRCFYWEILLKDKWITECLYWKKGGIFQSGDFVKKSTIKTMCLWSLHAKIEFSALRRGYILKKL